MKIQTIILVPSKIAFRTEDIILLEKNSYFKNNHSYNYRVSIYLKNGFSINIDYESVYADSNGGTFNNSEKDLETLIKLWNDDIHEASSYYMLISGIAKSGRI